MKRILFIDDDEIVLSTFSSIMSSLNYSVTTCNESRTGLELALHTDFKLIITDLKMPELSGVDLIKRIIEKKPDSIIYLLTSFKTDDVVKSVLDSGATGIMDKPFEVSKIVTIMNRL